ncbi:Hypothetical predicted protein [Octopus vulgaris]|uniref:C2H2-type domain-containing protein n=1 Tax=Octopus vulgaris TaxID=6645 RepID=A0AA36FI97_OCTVU|nr:Hypothetical predicted protein [Octopus vulgaris]
MTSNHNLPPIQLTFAERNLRISNDIGRNNICSEIVCYNIYFNICGKRFSAGSVLTYKLIHIGKGSYCCDICGKSLSERSN